MTRTFVQVIIEYQDAKERVEMTDELEPMGDAENLVFQAEEVCADAAFYGKCEQRVPELSPGVFDELVDLGSADEYEREFRRWCDWLDELDAMVASQRSRRAAEIAGEALAADLAECQEYLDGVGWIEDGHGGAVYVEHVDDDEDE